MMFKTISCSNIDQIYRQRGGGILTGHTRMQTKEGIAGHTVGGQDIGRQGIGGQDTEGPDMEGSRAEGMAPELQRAEHRSRAGKTRARH
jgi:hypothetical protein